MKNTWTSRDLPVLDAVVTLLDQGAVDPGAAEIAARTGLEPADVTAAFRAGR